MQTGDDTMTMESMVFIAYCMGNKEEFSQAEVYFDSSISYARSLNTPLRLAHLLVEKSRILTGLGRTENALDNCREALEIAIAHHSAVTEADVYMELNSYYEVLDNYSLQLDYLNKSIRIYDSLKMYSEVALSYKEISVIYSKQKRYKEALQYAMMVDSVYKKTGDNYDRNTLKMHIGIVYKNMGEYDKAIRLYGEGLDSFRKNSFLGMYIISNLAIAQSLKGDFAGATRSFFITDSLNKIYKVTSVEIENQQEHGRAFMRIKQYDSALYYAKLSEQLCERYKPDLYAWKETVSLLSDVYVASGDMANAHIYDKKYEVLQDSIYNKMQANNLADAETRFNLSEKNKELSVLTTENELQKVKAQKQRLLNISLLVGLCLGILIVGLIVSAYRRTLKKNTLLSDQKQELQQQKQILEAQKQTLQEQKDIIDKQVTELANAATMKSKFLANISHELRTPVTLLTGMLELMHSKTDKQDSKDKQRVDIAYNSSRKLQYMVEEILSLTKLQNNIAEPVFEILELTPLLKRVVYTFETLVEKEKLGLEFSASGTDDLCISMDVKMFEKIINNLIYNAVKFNHEGGWIKVAIHPVAGNKDIIIDISDSGRGISETDLPHIFEHFYQGNSQDAKAEGAGIGLSLVKEYTLLLGGTIKVNSIPGTGTTFSLCFPVVEKAAATNETEDEIVSLPEVAWDNFAERQTVLIVEDNPEMRYYLKEVLGDNVNIATAGNGIEAMKWLEDKTPDLVISDVMMPGMDGKQLINELKKSDRYKTIPIITLTALADTENQLSFLRMGVDDYIVKPFNVDELRIRVYNLLTNYAARKAFNHEPQEAGDIKQDSPEAETFRKRVTEYVLANLKTRNISVYDLAGELVLSERQLYRLCSSLTGYSPAQLIKEIKLQKAYELLLSGDIYKVEDVCKRAGFEKASYFSQQFLERFGKRPTEFL